MLKARKKQVRAGNKGGGHPFYRRHLFTIVICWPGIFRHHPCQRGEEIVTVKIPKSDCPKQVARKTLSCVMGSAFLAVALAMSAHASQSAAQSFAPAAQSAPPAATAPAPPPSPMDIAGIWQATLTPPNGQKGTRIVMKVTKDAGGSYAASLYNADQGSPPLKFATVTMQGADVKFATPMITIQGQLSTDGKTLDGNWNAGPNSIPISFARTAPDAAWPIPEPAKAMAADADPGFDALTVKPSPPGRPGKNFGMNGTHFRTVNSNLNDLIAFAYGLHAKQIVGGPAWFDTDLYDIDGVPDVPGQPSVKQMGIMVQKLLADRFQLRFHHETRELSVYAITLASGGPKMTKTTASPNDPPGFGFRGLGDLSVRNLTMANFAMWMQASVTDRPMVDQTGLKDRYDFQLKWTPDESQFAQFRGAGMTIPPPSDDANAPPSLYTAVQEQLGLKIETTKAPDDVIVIDHVEKASAN